MLYWNVGEYVSQKVNNGIWGDDVVGGLADYIQKKQPNLRGFNKRGLYRMRQLFETYQGFEKVSPLVTQISWSANLIILSKCKEPEEQQFYVLLSVKEKLSKRELIRKIDSGTFERTMLSTQKVSPLVTQLQESVSQAFKDTYVFEFLDLPENHSEKDLQQNLILNLKDFLLEMGNGFTFVGQEYRVQVGMKDFYIDLLLYHRELRSLVAIELKTTDFQPEHIGKLNFYLEALDSNVKMPHEKPSIGILLCKGKDSEVVEFSLRRNLSPAMVADYELKLIDKEVLKKKLNELFEAFDK
jgi:predicted nuclease of restriction endonuclease-like (RecB) superfamily